MTKDNKPMDKTRRERIEGCVLEYTKLITGWDEKLLKSRLESTLDLTNVIFDIEQLIQTEVDEALREVLDQAISNSWPYIDISETQRKAIGIDALRRIIEGQLEGYSESPTKI